MAAAVLSLAATPFSALCTVLQGASCVCSTLNFMTCLFQSATGKKSGVSPTAAKMFYVLLLGFFTFLAMILRYHSENFHFGGFTGLTCESATDGSNLVHCKGDNIVFRISFILSLFFGLMTALSLSSEGMHRGYWGIKIFVVVCGIIGSWFIPAESFNVHAYAWIARLGSILFLLLQILILIDWAYQLNESWVAKAYNGDVGGYGEATNRNWLVAVLSVSGALYVFSFVGIVLLFTYYTKCGVGIAFSTVTLLAVVCMTTLALFRDRVVEIEMQGAIFPAAVVVTYIVFLCWSALESNPDASCRPALKHDGLDLTVGSLFAAFTLMWSAMSVTSNAANLVKGEALIKAADANSTSEENGIGGAPIMQSDLEEQMLTEDDDDTPVETNEPVWIFHLIMTCASMYMAMLLTDWGSFKGPAAAGEASMWVKIVSQWLTSLLFCWTLIAPAILKNRDWA